MLRSTRNFLRESTFNRWKNQFPAFCVSLNEGKTIADVEVASSIYRGTTGRPGYSEKTAYKTGAENLKKPEIEKAISGAMNLRAKRTRIRPKDLWPAFFESVQEGKKWLTLKVLRAMPEGIVIDLPTMEEHDPSEPPSS